MCAILCSQPVVCEQVRGGWLVASYGKYSLVFFVWRGYLVWNALWMFLCGYCMNVRQCGLVCVESRCRYGVEGFLVPLSVHVNS